ncbi:hypothetical protein DPMN_037610 [Dreissena polymorpha]|uniref:Uncharacterized protein n=1 Tax=Dreissena polymorpha TaxID=45954 RepID=A0A9D4MCY2_DREPO|nr:hypothetical protein DPMN_037610 [Dreissena polymorpha]
MQFTAHQSTHPAQFLDTVHCTPINSPCVVLGYSSPHTNQTPRCCRYDTRHFPGPSHDLPQSQGRAPRRCRSGTDSWSELATPLPLCLSASRMVRCPVCIEACGQLGLCCSKIIMIQRLTPYYLD